MDFNIQRPTGSSNCGEPSPLPFKIVAPATNDCGCPTPNVSFNVSNPNPQPSGEIFFMWDRIIGRPSCLDSCDTVLAHIKNNLLFSDLNNIPTTLAGYGITDAVNISRSLTINDVTYNLAEDRTWNVGTVTSVGITAPLGMTASAPITSSGNIALTLDEGYTIPLYADVQKGVIAYNWGNHAGLYIHNQTTEQALSNFYVSGNGKLGGSLFIDHTTEISSNGEYMSFNPGGTPAMVLGYNDATFTGGITSGNSFNINANATSVQWTNAGNKVSMNANSGVMGLYTGTGADYVLALRIDENQEAVFSNTLTADSFIKHAGLSTQFLKADGSVDGNTYLTSADLTNYYTKTQVNNFFSGSTAIIGYNNVNWNTAYNYSQVGHVTLASVGAAGGVAPLDGSSKIPAIYLPSYVDDVVDVANYAALPAVGESSKIYITIDTGKTYRWSGSTYAEVSPSDVNSVNGETGIVTLTTSHITEGSRLYYTDTRVKTYGDTQWSLLGHTHTFTSLTSIPTTLAGYGITDPILLTSRTLTVNGVTQDLTANRTWNVGTVTSVGLSVPTGFTVSNSPVTASGTLGLSFTVGYSLPTDVRQAQWDTAYTNSHTHANKAFLDTVVSGATLAFNITGNSATSTLASNSTLWAGYPANFGTIVNSAPDYAVGFQGGIAKPFSVGALQSMLGITGGPFLPLTAGSGNALSNYLYFNNNTLGLIIGTNASINPGIQGNSSNGLELVTSNVIRYTIGASGNNTWTGGGTFGGTLAVNGGSIQLTGSLPYIQFNNTDTTTEGYYIQASVNSVGSAYGNYMLFYAPTGKSFAFNQGISAGSAYSWIRESYFGYSSTYRTQILGATSGSHTLAFGVDLISNPSGAFQGNGTDYVWRNAGQFITPNSANTGYNTLYSWNSSGQVTFNKQVTGADTGDGSLYNTAQFKAFSASSNAGYGFHISGVYARALWMDTAGNLNWQGGVNITPLAGTGTRMVVADSAGALSTQAIPSGGGGGIASVGVSSANGFAGTSSGGSNPALTISTTITGMLKGNGTAMSAATAGTDYLTPTGNGSGLTSITASNISAGTAGINISGNAATVTHTSYSSSGSYPINWHSGGVIYYTPGITITPNTSTITATNFAGNATMVNGQSFTYSNTSDSPTYLWATNSNGSSFLAHRASIAVNYANSAGGVAWTNVSGRPTALSGLSNDLIYSWALASTKPSYVWTEISSRPTALSQFSNDLGLGARAYDNTAYIPLAGGYATGKIDVEINNGYSGSTGWENGSYTMTDGSNTARKFSLGFSNSGFAFMQAGQLGAGYPHIVMQASGGKVNIGTVYDLGGMLNVNGTMVSYGLYVSGGATITGALTAATVTGTSGGFDSDMTLKNVNSWDLSDRYFADRVKPMSFHWKDPKKGTDLRFGYPAQEIQKLLPEAVYVTNAGTLAVDYTQVHTVLIDENTKRIQYLEKEVKELKSKLSEHGLV